MNYELSLNTQAILLLTAPLLIGKTKSPVQQLNAGEYGKLAQSLKVAGRQPADLLTPEAGAILREIAPDFVGDRITQLLERGFLLSLAVEHWQTRAIWVISLEDPEYPPRFKQRLDSAAPPVLYGCGDETLLNNGGLAVVGSRDARDETMEYAHSIGRLAAAAQCAIISGGARGVDTAAMRGALSESGTVIGVLGDKLETAALHRDNRDVLMDGRLVLVSPYDPKAGFNVGNLMQRNKLVYALADAGLVVESAYQKGGTWAGAVEQLKELHLVPIYIRAQGEVSRGLKALQQMGASEWPNPQTEDEFGQVIASRPLLQKLDAPSQGAFHLESKGETASPYEAVVEQDTVPTPINEHSDADEIAPADALFAKAEELLKGIKTPLTTDDVAESLQIPKKLAQDWLKRLEQEGKYQRQTRPVRYIRNS